MSNTSATSGFTKIAQVSLAENANHQSFPASAAVPARWVRLNVQNNHGDKDNIELQEVRAFGKITARLPLANVAGDYISNSGDMQLKQDGASVVGCYGTNGGTIDGGVDGRTLKFTWRENGGDAGTAVVNFSDDRKEFFGLYWHNGEGGGGAVWSAWSWSRALRRQAGADPRLRATGDVDDVDAVARQQARGGDGPIPAGADDRHLPLARHLGQAPRELREG